MHARCVLHLRCVPCRDGLERVQVPNTGTLADLWTAVSKALNIPLESMALSKDPKLVRLYFAHH